MALNFPDIDPVAISLGPLEIRWYALAYLAGFILGWRYALYLAGLFGKDQDRAEAKPGHRQVDRAAIDDFLTWAIIGVILGGRLGYVLFYQFDLYLQDPLEIFKLWHGGMAFHGGAVGVMLAMGLFAWRRKLPVLRLSDIVATVVPVGLFFGRIANFINGELFGRASDVPWAVLFPGGDGVLRHPSQLYEALLEGVCLAVLMAVLAHRADIRNRPGLLSGVLLAGYGLARFAVEFFREPDIQIGLIMQAVSMGQILSLPMILCGFGLIAYAVRKGRS